MSSASLIEAIDASAKQLVGDRDPKGHEFSIQMRAIDNDKSGASLGLPVLLALSSALLPAFGNRLKRKDERGFRLSWDASQSEPRTPLIPLPYLELEIERFVDKMRPKSRE